MLRKQILAMTLVLTALSINSVTPSFADAASSDTKSDASAASKTMTDATETKTEAMETKTETAVKTGDAPTKKQMIEQLMTILNPQKLGDDTHKMQMTEWSKLAPEVTEIYAAGYILENAQSKMSDAELESKAKTHAEKMVKREGELMDQKLGDLGKVSSEAMASQYDQAFSEDELKQLIAFYQTDAGKKLLDKAPVIETAVEDKLDDHTRLALKSIEKQMETEGFMSSKYKSQARTEVKSSTSGAGSTNKPAAAVKHTAKKTTATSTTTKKK